MAESNLYVGNLNYSVTAEQLKELFAKYGEVKNANVIPNKGFGFVEFENTEDATKAKDELNGTDFEGRALKVNEAQPRQPRNDFGSRY
ncbi:MAG: RNA-binding protein [Candidatus Diapherotrites archaeon]|nr:RNA-binding protein [Candidatus Diapherotrites archaeon]